MIAKRKICEHLYCAISFSLVELLVVIAIISILMSLLFPSIIKVKEKTKSIKCTSNLKQIGIGMIGYLQDYKEYFPQHQAAWFTQFNLYVGSQKLFCCPSDNDFAFDGNKISYGYNCNYLGNSTRPPDHVYYFCRLTQISYPSKMIAVTDSDRDKVNDFIISNTSPEDGGTRLVGTAHNKGPNILWVDGHVNWYPFRTAQYVNDWFLRKPVDTPPYRIH